MTAPAWAPALTDVAGLLSDRDLENHTFTDPGEETTGTVPTGSWVQGRIDAVSARVVAIVGAIPVTLEPLAAECVLYGVAADVDSGWTSARNRDEVTRGLDYRSVHEKLLTALGGALDEAAVPVVATSPSYAFPCAQVPDRVLW